MREMTLAFVSKSTNGDALKLRATRELLARMTATWRNSAGESLANRYAALHVAVDAEINQVKAGILLPIPCARGCNHCCKFNQIAVTQYEAVVLVRHIEGLDPEQRAVVVARILASRQRSGGGNVSPCVLLGAQTCSVYAGRPLPCRGYYSLSEAACNARLNDGAGDPLNLAATRVVEFAALEVSQATKHPPYEINKLLSKIYSDPAKIALWASGEPTLEPEALL